ncbi:site-determining protein [Geomonas sp. Red276]
MSSLHGSADQADTLRQLAGRTKNRPTAERLKLREGLRVISVTSGKGGVGKSSVVVNVAESLAAAGKRVLIVDTGLGMTDICMRLGREAHYSLGHVIGGERSMEETVVEAAPGISILPAGLGMHQYSALSPSERVSLLQGMIRLQDRFDYYLIDTAPGLAANVTGFAAASREIMLVITPEPTSITDAYALMKTLSGRDPGLKFKLLVNMCRNAEEGSTLFNKLSAITGRFLEISMEYAGCILQDEMLVESAKRRGPVCRLFPDSRASLGFKSLAQRLLSETGVMPQMPGEPAASVTQWRKHELSS